MKIMYMEWRIMRHVPYGYLVQKQVGRQWKHPSYHAKLSDALMDVFDKALIKTSSGEAITLQNYESELKRHAELIASTKSDILEAANGLR